MNTFHSVPTVLAAGCVLLATLPALAQKDNRPYLNFDAGLSLAPSQGARDLQNRSETSDLEYDAGYRVGLSFGYFLRNGGLFAYGGGIESFNLALELEASAIFNQAKSGSDDLAEVGFEDLELYRFPVLLNVALDLPIITERFHLAIGAGVGGMISLAQSQRLDLGAGSDTDFTLAWQVGAKLAYDVTPNLTVGVFYKLLRLAEAEFGEDVQLSLDGDFTHTMGLSVTWKF